MGTTPCSSTNFTKRTNFSDFLFVSLEDVALITLLHSERPKLHRVFAVLSAIELKWGLLLCKTNSQRTVVAFQ